MYGSQVAAILVSVLAIVIGAAAQDDGSTIAATDPDQWLTELNDGNWREAAAIAHRWADLPPDQGYDLLAEAWGRITNPQAKQQILKGFYYKGPMPLRTRLHPRLVDVLHLGATDPSPKVQIWAMRFAKRTAFEDFTEDFTAYQRWNEQARGRPIEAVVVERCRWFVEQMKLAGVDERPRLAAVLGDLRTDFRDVAALRVAAREAGMLQMCADWLAFPPLPVPEVSRQILKVLPELQPDEAYLRRVVLPLVHQADTQAEACLALGRPENQWAVDELLVVVTDSLKVPRSKPGFPAQALAGIGDPRVIPTLIGVIEADDTGEAIYGVGYFGLGGLTGVGYDKAHDGPWWRGWWERNRQRFPAVAAMEIPTLVAEAPPQVAALSAGDDPNMSYFLIPPRGTKPPADGYRLLMVIPGGDGSADFRPFVERIAEASVGEHYIVAQLVAPRWSDDQFDSVVWPTRSNPWPGMAFSSEDFIAAVVEDVKTRHPIDERYVFALAWSSGGPMVYAASLARDRPITGSLIAMSVFRPEQLPPLSAAKGRCYYLLHSPEDFIAMSHPTAARDQLAANGATVTLVTYEGGHGWHGDVFGNIRAGLVWLEGCRGGNGGTVDSGGEAVRRE